MITDKEKTAFLVSQGWHTKWLGKRIIKYIDPVLGDGYYADRDLTKPYKIAKRRKSARDSRRLKAAGWRWMGLDNVHGHWYGPKPIQGPHTRAEALSILAARKDNT